MILLIILFLEARINHVFSINIIFVVEGKVCFVLFLTP